MLAAICKACCGASDCFDKALGPAAAMDADGLALPLELDRGRATVPKLLIRAGALKLAPPLPQCVGVEAPAVALPVLALQAFQPGAAP